MIFEHKSVLLNEIIKNLSIKEDGTYVDATLGGAGHALEVCRRLSEKGHFIGIDQDEDAIESSKLRLKDYMDRVDIVKSNYVNIKNILESLNVDRVDGIYIDLGVSSYQLDNAERGFSYRFDSALDMRMDKSLDITAQDIVNDYSEQELYRIIKNYGEDIFAKNIAKHIVIARKEKRIESGLELVEIIKRAIPKKFQITSGHPAKRTFQAIRIELNKELEVLENSLETMIDLLKPNGRLLVISFHSLEDRIVKNIFKRCENPCTCPKNFPVCVCGNKSKGKVLMRKPILPSEEESEANPRAKSAKLRIFVKT
jgi:S-adenosyl-methyltransferase mraW